MKLHDLSVFEMEQLHRERMRDDFPPTELKPFFMIRDLLARGVYRCLGLEEHGAVVGYACLYQDGAGTMPLLDYLGVFREHRGRGLGTAFLELLKEACSDAPGILLEVEDPNCAADAADRENRLRRMAFYTRAGLRRTQIDVWLYDVDYAILVQDTGAPVSPETIWQGLVHVYRGILSPDGWENHLRLYPEGRR